MQTRVDKQQDKFFDDLLESIRPDNEEIIERRISHITFAKIISWLCLESRKRHIFKKQELRGFIGLTNSRVQEILNDLINSGLIKKKTDPSGKNYFVFTKNETSGELVIRKYFDRALKTLDKKPRRKITFEIEQEMGEDDYF